MPGERQVPVIACFLALFCTAQPSFCHDAAALARRDAAPCTAAAAAPADQDIVHYAIDLEIFPAEQELSGVCDVVFTAGTAPLSQLLLELRSLEVESITGPGGSLAFSHVGDTLLVDLGATLFPGDTSSVEVHYSGQPWNEGAGKFGGFWFHPYVSYQMGVGVYTTPPSLGKCFFPCHDHPADKASFDFLVTVDDTVEVVANGYLQGVAYSGGRATWHWTLDEQMSTYLAAVSASEYVDLVDSTYSWIHYYVYPSDVADALGSFQNVDKMMTLFQSLFGPYPWDCKFSYVETPKGDMEHTSQVYHLQSLINGQTNHDPIVAHEMGHMWWGDCVTEAEWNDVWLSEGFATYCEALWAGYYGPAAYDQYMVSSIMTPYLQSGETFPLGEPEELWGYTTYQKGASVLHMLRHVVGDECFFEALNVYFDAHAFGLATTQDLEGHFEDCWGDDLGWFFDEWVYGTGYPAYDIDYEIQQSGSSWDLSISVYQIQGSGTFFTMPLEFAAHGSGGDSLLTMWNEVQGDTETFTLQFEPASVVFDPGHFVLSTSLLGVEPEVPPGGTGLLRVSPNPAGSSIRLDWSGMEGETLDVRLYDLMGRVVASQTLEPFERCLTPIRLPAGTYILEASGRNGIRQSARMTILGR